MGQGSVGTHRRDVTNLRGNVSVLEGSGGEGIILSVGGGVSPGMPRENVVAMLEALNEFNAARSASARETANA